MRIKLLLELPETTLRKICGSEVETRALVCGVKVLGGGVQK